MVDVHRGRPTTGTDPPPRGRRLLVLANVAAPSADVVEAVQALLAEHARGRVLFVAPALYSRAAVRRLQACIDSLAAIGVEAEGMIGDADPLQAIEDALRIFPADLVILAPLAQDRTNSFAGEVAALAQRRFRLPTYRILGGALAA